LITLLITYDDSQEYDDDLIEEDLQDDELIVEEALTDDEELTEEKEIAEIDKDYTSSTIERCIIVNSKGGIVTDKNKFRGILVDIWETMEKQKILENTTYKFKNGNKRGAKGYNWCERINMSFQDRNSNAALQEILCMVKVNNLAIDLKITLDTGESVHIVN
jgi:hypothetical protein